MTDPKVVLQAHALRTRRTGQALLHGTTRVRAARGDIVPALIASAVLTMVIVVVVVVAVRIARVLHQTGR